MTAQTFGKNVASFYEQYLVPMLFEPYADDMARRVSSRPEARVLELAAGTGVVTRRLAAARSDASASIVATDISPAMLELGQRLCPTVEWRQADAMALPFPDASFDLVICEFGAMFFSDRSRAYAEARRVLRTGGSFVFSSWDRIEANEFAHIAQEAVAAMFPGNPPVFLPRVPYGYFDTDTIRADLRRAGFEKPPLIDTVAEISRAPSALVPAQGYVLGSLLRDEIEARDPAKLDEAVAVAERALATRFGNGPVEARMGAFVFSVPR